MKTFVANKKTEIASDTEDSKVNDLFTSLVRASEQSGKLKLSDQELVIVSIYAKYLSVLISLVQIGDVFSFMFAGHGL